MKKYFLLFMILQCSTILPQDLEYGIIVGKNFNTITSKPQNYNQTGENVDFNSRQSYNLGFISTYKLSNYFDLSASLLYINNIVSTNWSGPADGNVDATLFYRYISLSPKLQITPILDLYLSTGPTLDFNIDTKLELKGDYVTDSKEIPSTEPLRIGANFCVGYKFYLFKGLSLAPEYSYDMGVSNTNKVYGGKYSTSRLSVIFFIN